jgi:polysaccharide pyruvyl transferase WcaK-like protein
VSSAFDLLRRGARRALSTARAVDADKALMASMAAGIELSATRYALDRGATWEPGQPLKLLLAGYCGTRNTGADVRVEEMIRQLRHLFGDEHIDLSVLTIHPENSRGYFRTVKQLHLPQIYPAFLVQTVHEMHGVLACEGSMFKSKFANALSTMMVGALGLALAEGKLAVGYGGEAGTMDPALEALVRRYVRGALVIARNEASAGVLEPLGVSTRLGTDTAWTFEAAAPERAEAVLREAGWNGGDNLLALCPINPFWWPVKPDVGKGMLHALTGAHARDHYASVYFHAAGPEVERQQEAYLDAIADAVLRLGSRVTPVCVGMEMLDRGACEGLSERLGGAPVIVSDEHDMYDMVAVLRRCAMVASSRYHALVTSMPAGVPSVGITMDERIANLMMDRGTPELALQVSDPDLADGLHEALVRLLDEPMAVRRGIERCVVAHLERLGTMGGILVDRVRAAHPELPLSPELGEHGDPWDHLPPMSASLTALVKRVRSE